MPVYNTNADFPRPHQLIMPQPVHLSELPLILRSSLPSVSRGLVYINTLVRTCPHELFIQYERVTAWEARFSSNKLEVNYHYQPPSALDGSMSGRINCRHYSLVKLQTTNWKEPLAELLTRLIRDHL